MNESVIRYCLIDTLSETIVRFAVYARCDLLQRPLCTLGIFLYFYSWYVCVCVCVCVGWVMCFIGRKVKLIGHYVLLDLSVLFHLSLIVQLLISHHGAIEM